MLRATAAFSEVPSSNPSTYMVAHNHLSVTLVSEDLMPSFGLYGYTCAHTWYTDLNTGKIPIHIKTKSLIGFNQEIPCFQHCGSTEDLAENKTTQGPALKS